MFSQIIIFFSKKDHLVVHYEGIIFMKTFLPLNNMQNTTDIFFELVNTNTQPGISIQCRYFILP